MNSTLPKPPKKPYQTPSLRVYGDIERVTKAAPSGSMNDNAMGPAKTA